MILYGYGLGDPVNGADRSGLAMSWVCTPTPPNGAGCGTNPSCRNPVVGVDCWYSDYTSVTAPAPPPAEPMGSPIAPNIGIPPASPYATGPQGHPSGPSGVGTAAIATVSQPTAEPTKLEGPNLKAALRALVATWVTDLVADYANRQPCGPMKQTLHSAATIGYTAAGGEFAAVSVRAGLGAAVTPPGVDVLALGMSAMFAAASGDSLGKAWAQGELAFSKDGCR
jgi:hypothetical protein